MVNRRICASGRTLRKGARESGAAAAGPFARPMRGAGGVKGLTADVIGLCGCDRRNAAETRRLVGAMRYAHHHHEAAHRRRARRRSRPLWPPLYGSQARRPLERDRPASTQIAAAWGRVGDARRPAALSRAGGGRRPCGGPANTVGIRRLGSRSSRRLTGAGVEVRMVKAQSPKPNAQQTGRNRQPPPKNKKAPNRGPSSRIAKSRSLSPSSPARRAGP